MTNYIEEENKIDLLGKIALGVAVVGGSLFLAIASVGAVAGAKSSDIYQNVNSQAQMASQVDELYINKLGLHEDQGKYYMDLYGQQKDKDNSYKLTYQIQQKDYQSLGEYIADSNDFNEFLNKGLTDSKNDFKQDSVIAFEDIKGFGGMGSLNFYRDVRDVLTDQTPIEVSIQTYAADYSNQAQIANDYFME